MTLTPSSLARAIMSTLFLDETACAILYYVSPWYMIRVMGRTNSAAKVLLCMRRRSTSRVLLTRKALWPEGIMWRVFLLDPKPIYTHHQNSVPSVDCWRWAQGLPLKDDPSHTTNGCHRSQRTDGITICPLNRLRTRLSIPLGFLQLGSTHLNLSL